MALLNPKMKRRLCIGGAAAGAAALGYVAYEYLSCPEILKPDVEGHATVPDLLYCTSKWNPVDGCLYIVDTFDQAVWRQKLTDSGEAVGKLEQVLHLEGEECPTSVAFLPDGRVLVATGLTRRIMVVPEGADPEAPPEVLVDFSKQEDSPAWEMAVDSKGGVHITSWGCHAETWVYDMANIKLGKILYIPPENLKLPGEAEDNAEANVEDNAEEEIEDQGESNKEVTKEDKSVKSPAEAEDGTKDGDEDQEDDKEEKFHDALENASHTDAEDSDDAPPGATGGTEASDDAKLENANPPSAGTGGDGTTDAKPPNKPQTPIRKPVEAKVIAENLAFGGASVMTPDGKTMYAASAFSHHILAWDRDPETGLLSNQRIWATLQHTFPVGLALDMEGCLWVSLAVLGADINGALSPIASFVLRKMGDHGMVVRLKEGGKILDSKVIRGKQPLTITFGGEDGRTLFVACNTLVYWSQRAYMQEGNGCITSFRVDVPAMRSPENPYYIGGRS